MLFRRSDGRPIADVPEYRQMMPYLMPSKNTAHVFSDFTVDMEKALDLVNAPPPELAGTLTLTHLFLRAGVLTLAQYPELNRFVAGSRLYQREGIWFSFSAKKAFTEEAPVVVIKSRFEPSESLVDMAARLKEQLARGRSDQKSFADKESDFLLKMPRFVIRRVLALQSMLDDFNLLPAEMIEKDIFYSSAFIANLGSIGIDGGYHHLYEYGNIPIFMTIGRVKRQPVFSDSGAVSMRPLCELRLTMDERITDGFYASKALDYFKNLLENPDKL